MRIHQALIQKSKKVSLYGIKSKECLLVSLKDKIKDFDLIKESLDEHILQILKYNTLTEYICLDITDNFSINYFLDNNYNLTLKETKAILTKDVRDVKEVI